MLNWFLIHFIPHNLNSHRPHFLLGQSIRQLVGIIFGVELILFILPTLTFPHLVNQNIGAVLPGVISTLTNERRELVNLPTLAESSLLNHAAQMKAEDMAARGYFAHSSPDGKTPWYWLERAGYIYSYAGENLAVNFVDSTDVTQAWMNSPTHQANIVGANYTEVGTGVAVGKYQGKETVFVAQVYARPAISVQEPNPIAQTGSAEEFSEKSSDVLSEAWPDFPTNSSASLDSEPNLAQIALASPRQTTNIVIFVALGIVVTALILNIFIKFEHHHPDLVTNGLAVIAIVFAIHLINIHIVRAQSPETSFTSFEPISVQKE